MTKLLAWFAAFDAWVIREHLVWPVVVAALVGFLYPNKPELHIRLVSVGLAFLIILRVLVYHKKCSVLDVFEKPPLFQKPSLYVPYATARLLVSWGSVAGVWYYGGALAGVVAAALYFVVGTVALRYYYERQLAVWRSTFEKTERQAEGLSADSPMPQPSLERVQRLAREAVDNAMKNRW